MTPVKATASSRLQQRHLKIGFWGATATRKTETILRFFPDVLLIDSEGNGEMCAHIPEIGEFLYLQTKDPRVVMEALDDVKKGLLKFPDGRPVRTVGIDSTTVLWSVQQELAYTLAAARAERKNYRDAENANATQGEWATAKRPLRQLNTRINASGIQYIIYTAREKDLYKEEGAGDTKVLKKIGVIPDWVKGTEYEMNLVMRFAIDNGVWTWEVTKTQGALGKVLPLGKKGTRFPIEEILAFAVSGQSAEEDDADRAIADQAARANRPRTFKTLLEIGAEKRMTEQQVRDTLRQKGFNGFNPEHFEAYIDALG